MYADLDFEALKNVEELLVGHKVYLAAMGTDEDFAHHVPNAWMASIPGHPFWLFCLQQVTKLNYRRCAPVPASTSTHSSFLPPRMDSSPWRPEQFHCGAGVTTKLSLLR